ncbi:MAG TPA: segregation/condensation protein A [Spirochaetia bacterium]|nr:segregation/condensation protein A [Spirochaetales bacterium]HRS65331.1 segregation/condensation protein A [Spirochaetia bacterium]HPD79944.1 segregation/condensation protein A [Spirochaetales bacterium]HQG39550.1 segregation/condensation protein A [Spirochaetales bacterium]HQK33496.1 segregation/condensation protein A [Spirochaetales bacterium]
MANNYSIDQTVFDSEKPRFVLKDFEGPLDLLLYLIKKNEVNIYDIPIALITDQFLECLASSDSIDLDDLTEFYALAATLIYIKSKMLLPIETDLDAEIEDPRSIIVDKLIEYQKYKKLSELIEKKELETEFYLEKKNAQRMLPFQDENLWESIDVWDLLQTFTRFTKSMSRERIIDLFEEVSINEKSALIYELLEKKDSFEFEELIVRPNSLMDIICAFLALLEAVKYKIISIAQHKLFGTILIRKAETKIIKEGNDGT